MAVPAFLVLASGMLLWWFLYNPVRGFRTSVPGMDERKTGTLSLPKVAIGEIFSRFKEGSEAPGTNWPRFRGAEYDNICKENISLIDKFPPSGPRILWKKTLGEGHAAPAVYNGQVFILDYNETLKQDMLRCFDLKSGDELWQRGYNVKLKRNHGLSRTIPAVSNSYVVTIGPRCQVMCVDRKSGDYLWGLDLANEYKTEVPFWYTGQCPLIDNDTAVIATGGNSLLIGIDCKTGKKVWETPNTHGWKMSHSSIMPMRINGTKMYVYCAIGGIVGVSAQGSEKGKILWESTGFAPSVVAPSPLMLPGDRIFVTAGYGAGSALLQIAKQGENYSARIVSKYKPSEGLASEQQTPICKDGFIFGILPKDAGELRTRFACYEAGNPQKVVMSSNKDERFGLGPYILADNKFFILNDDGELSIAKYSATRFTVLDKARIIDGQDSWGPLVITGGYLLMRDSKTLVCIDVTAH